MPLTPQKSTALAPRLQDPSRILKAKELYQEALEFYKDELVTQYHRGVAYLKRKDNILNIPPSASIGYDCIFIADQINFGESVKVGSNSLIGTINEPGSITIISQVTIGNNSVLMNNAYMDYAYRYPDASILIERLEEDEED